MRIYCNDCAHKNVCIYQKDYNAIISKIDLLTIDGPFDLELKCRHYGVDPYSFYCSSQDLNSVLHTNGGITPINCSNDCDCKEHQ